MKRSIYFEKGGDYEPSITEFKIPTTTTDDAPMPEVTPPIIKRKRPDVTTDFHENRDYLKSLPIYLIVAHSVLPPIGVPCFRDRPQISFEIPDDTHVISFAQSNDVFCGTEQTDKLIVVHQDSLCDYLFLHDIDDIREIDSVGTTDFSFFSGLLRATATAEYPNIAYTFNNGDLSGAEHNPYGVYRIDLMSDHEGIEVFNNTKSIVKENLTRNNFMLKDVIEEVYDATGSRKGIFISTGCLPICPTTSISKKIARESVKFAGNLLHIANNEYRTTRPTWTRTEIDAMGLLDLIPFDIAVKYPMTAMDPAELIEMEQEQLSEAKMIIERMPFLLADRDDRAVVTKHILKATSTLDVQL